MMSSCKCRDEGTYSQAAVLGLPLSPTIPSLWFRFDYGALSQ